MIELRFLVLLFGGALAVCGPRKPCAGVTPMEDFDVTQYDGIWYVVEKYPVASNLQEKCIKQYFHNLAIDSVRLVTWTVDAETAEQRKDDGYAKFIGGEARFNEYYSGLLYEEQWMLGTDYETYAVHFACADLSPYKVNNVWIMAKTRQPSEYSLSLAHQVLIDNGLSVDELEKEEWLLCPNL